ncbi:MAG TPA: flagellin [Fimbriimonadaceae bacterium]|nr:flagellin [Fimbriimonadaceae bacterium]
MENTVGLRINTNIPAMTALRNLNINDEQLQGVTTRLSTGLRINTAGDDPAGLVISEALRAHISGLGQAIKNTQDAVNMAKTAEGALNEVSRLILSLRSLAIHAANTAVVDATQLQADQSQVRSVLQSIDRIATHTSWGTKKLLNGSAGTTAGITRTDLVNSMYIGGEFAGQPVADGPITIAQVTQATQTTTGPLATVFADSTALVNAGTFVLNGTTFTVQAGESLADVTAKINEQTDTTGVTASIVPNGAGFSIDLTSVKYGSNFPISYLETSDILNGGAAANPVAGTDAVYTVTTNVQPSGTATETFTGGQGAGVDGLTLTSSSGNKMVISVAGNNNAAATVVGQLSVGTMNFQIGALAGQNVGFSIPSFFAKDMGTNAVPGKSLADIDLTTSQGAQDAIRIIDDAVSGVSLLRGDLGSFQANFLESTTRSLSIAQENMTASESTIRDADVAKEMTDFTKVQILRQSGMAVLAQANQSAQSVLTLFGR